MQISTFFGIIGISLAFIAGVVGIGWAVIKVLAEIFDCDDTDVEKSENPKCE